MEREGRGRWARISELFFYKESKPKKKKFFFFWVAGWRGAGVSKYLLL